MLSFLFFEKSGDKKDFKVLKALFISTLNKSLTSDVILMICTICFGEKKNRVGVKRQSKLTSP